MVNLMKPTVKLKAKKPQFALYGHILSLIGSLVPVVFGLLALVTLNFNGLIGLIGGLFILLVEIDTIKLDFLKDSLVRGIVWIILAVVFGIGNILTSLIIIFGGVFYIIYHFQ